MPDNPIRHEDIIQPGNPFDETIKGIKELLRLLKETGKAASQAKEILMTVEKQNTATKEGRKNIESATKATQKLTTEERERLRMVRALEKELAKANLLKDKDYRATIKQAEAQKIANRELEKSIKAQAKGHGATNRWSKALGSFQFKFNALGNIAANVFARITAGITNYIKDAMKMAAAAEGVNRAFRSMNDPALLGKLREAVRGTVSDVKLMTAAVKANNFQIPLENLPKFFEFAAKRANETGEEVDYLVESIVNGIARRSLPILDNLGLSATELREEMKKTGDMAQAVSNIIERGMGDANQPLLTTGQLYDQAATNAENMKLQFGEIANLFWMKILPAANKFVTFLKEALQTQTMIERQVLDGLIIQQIEQDRLEVADIAARLEEKRVKLKEDQTYEERAALLLLGQYRTLLAGTAEEDVKRIESLSAQIKALEIMAGIKPQKDSVLENIDNIAKGIGDDSFTEDDIEGFDWSGLGLDTSEGEKRLSELEKQQQEKLRIQREAQQAEQDALEKAERKKQETIERSFEYANRLTTTLTDIFAAQKEKELSMAGDNAEKRAEIEKKYARREQILGISKAILDGASSIQKTKAQLGLPAAIPFMIADAAITAAQIGIIASQKFAEGGHGLLGDEGGVLGGRSHLQGGVNLGEIGEAERGEYFGIVNRQMAKKYSSELPMIFDSLNNGAFHEVWGRNRSKSGDPYTKKIYEVLSNTPQIGPLEKRIEKYPDGRTRIVNG